MHSSFWFFLISPFHFDRLSPSKLLPFSSEIWELTGVASLGRFLSLAGCSYRVPCLLACLLVVPGYFVVGESQVSVLFSPQTRTLPFSEAGLMLHDSLGIDSRPRFQMPALVRLLVCDIRPRSLPLFDFIASSSVVPPLLPSPKFPMPLSPEP